MREAVWELGAGVVSIVSFLSIFLIFTGQNGLMCCICPDGRIWASGTMVEAMVAAAVGAGAGATPEKKAASGVILLLRKQDRPVSSSRALSFILLVFYFSVTLFFVNVFAFSETSKKSNPVVGVVSNGPVLRYKLHQIIIKHIQ